MSAPDKTLTPGDWFDRVMRALTPILLAYIAANGTGGGNLEPIPHPQPLPPVVVPADETARQFEKLFDRLDELAGEIDELREGGQ